MADDARLADVLALGQITPPRTQLYHHASLRNLSHSATPEALRARPSSRAGSLDNPAGHRHRASVKAEWGARRGRSGPQAQPPPPRARDPLTPTIPRQAGGAADLGLPDPGLRRR
jgi:hypothetical protein